MNIIEKLLNIKKELEEIKAEEKKQESWYNDMHEGSLGHTATVNDGGGGLECGIVKGMSMK